MIQAPGRPPHRPRHPDGAPSAWSASSCRWLAGHGRGRPAGARARPPAGWWCRVAEAGTGPAAAPVRPGALAPTAPCSARGWPASSATGRRSRWTLASSLLSARRARSRCTSSSTTCRCSAGWTSPPRCCVFGLANLCFSPGRPGRRPLDPMPTLLRAGTLDVLMLRPLPVLAQLVDQRRGAAPARPQRRRRSPCCRSALAPAGRGLDPGPGAAARGRAAGRRGDLRRDVRRRRRVQFWLVEGAELTNAFVYGGAYAASFPAAVLPSAAAGGLRVRRPGRVHRLPARRWRCSSCQARRGSRPGSAGARRWRRPGLARSRWRVWRARGPALHRERGG